MPKDEFARGKRLHPPEMVGGTFLVIDKETGEISSWPLADPETIAEDYRRQRRGRPG